MPHSSLPHARESSVVLRDRHGPNYRWRVLVTVMIGNVASIMSSTIVNVALPDMSRVFMLGQDRAQWLSAGFMAAMTISMLATPWLLERFGYRSAYMAVISLLMAGGIGGGLGWSFEWVLAMRVIEGLAAGLLQPIPTIIIMNAFGTNEQVRAMSLFSMGVVLAPAVGPGIGGVLVELFGWRSIFFFVVPFCIIALWMARRYLPQSAPGGTEMRRDRRFDSVGLVLLSVAILSLLNGMVDLQRGNHGLAAGLLCLAALALAAFVYKQRHTLHPLMQLGMFGHAQFAFGSCVAFMYGAALFGSTYLLPVFMQIALGLPPSQAGGALLPAGIMLWLTIALAGRLSNRLPLHQVVGFGLTLLALSFVLMLGVGLGTSLWIIALWIAVGRIGLGFVLPSLNLGAMRGLPMALIPQASSGINFMRQLGGAVGVSLAGIFLEWRLHAHGASLPSAVGSAAARAPSSVSAFHETFILLAVLTMIAIAAAWRMRAPPESAVPREAPH
ncbi:MAG: DHA2 family efflux MFS transporter permease subunit [Burkholderiales bacterium]